MLFVCIENSCRSQMAEDLFNAIAKNAVTESAGLKPAERVDEMVVKVMEEICIDINKKKPALLYQRRIKILISLL